MNAALTFLLTFAFAASAGEILMMDTLAFNSVKHARAKRDYVKSLVPMLRDLKIKTGEFDSARADQHEIYELILKDESWSDVMREVRSACAQPANAFACEKLSQLRMDTYAYIRQNPETATQ